MKRRSDKLYNDLQILNEKKRLISSIQMEKEKIRKFSESKKNYHWIDLPMISGWNNPNIFDDPNVRMFILQNLKDAFKLDFPNRLIIYFLSLLDNDNSNNNNIINMGNRFETKTNIEDEEKEKEKLQANFSNYIYSKIQSWITGFNSENLTEREYTWQQLWNIVLQETTATETALLFSLSNSRENLKDTFLNNGRIKWKNNYNYAMEFRDYNILLAAQRDKNIEEIIEYINSSCNNADDHYTFSNLIKDVNKNDYVYRTVFNEDFSYQRDDRKTAIILLNENNEYLGHVYVWLEYPTRLAMQGIRTSLINQILKQCKSTLAQNEVAFHILEGVKQFAKTNPNIRTIVAAGAIGGMSGLLEKLGWRGTPGWAVDMYWDLN